MWRAVVVAALVSLTLLAACSSDDDDAGTTTTTDERTDATDGEADGGTIDDTVPESPTPPVVEAAIDAPADFGDGVTARLASAEAVDVEAFLPGEVSGPGVELTVELTNGTSGALDLDALSVELVMSGDRYATLITQQEDTRLVGDLAPGATGQGTYVFTIPEEDRSAVAVRVNYSPPDPTVVFQGDLADV